MRAAPATVIGLMVGGVLGFLLHGWLDSAAEPSGASGESSTAAAGPPASVPPAPPPGRQAVVELPAPRVEARPAAAEAGPSETSTVSLVLSGEVREPDGKPAQLGNARSIQFDTGSGEIKSVDASRTSTYAISGLTPGRCVVRADFRGYRPYRHELELDPGQPNVRFDIVVEPAVVLMVKAFTPTGEPLAKALEVAGAKDVAIDPFAAVATREPPPPLLPATTLRNYSSWGIGRFLGSIDLIVERSALPEDALGRLELDESLPAYVSLVFRHIVLQTQLVEPGTTEVAFVVPLDDVTRLLGEVRVRVLSADTRQPIAGASANLSDSQSGGGHQMADETGTFTWEHQRPGRLELEIFAPGHERWDGEVSVPSGGVADLGTLELSPAQTLSGMVIDPAGQPVSLRLKAVPDEDRSLGMGDRMYQVSGADGRFSFEQLGRRPYLLVVSDQDCSALPVPVDMRQGSVQGAVVRVVHGTLVRVRAAWPESDRYDVCLITEGGVVVRDIEGWLGERVLVKRLAPSGYVAIVSSGGSELTRVPFSVADAELALNLSP